MDPVKKFLTEAGRKGGLATAKKYPTEVRRKWGAKGGRPKKHG